MRNHRILPLVVCGLAVSAALLSRPLAGAEAIREPVRLIFDTDIGNDVDDAMALCMIHALASRGECQPLAATITKDNPYAAPIVDLLNTFFGRPEIPIGMVRGGVTPQDGKYLRQVVTAEDNGQIRYPHTLRNSGEVPEAVGLLRKIYRGLQNDQPTNDLTSVLYAVRPERGYFDLSPAGRIVVENDGTTSFREDAGGPHRYLIVDPIQIARVREAQEWLCSQPPGK